MEWDEIDEMDTGGRLAGGGYLVYWPALLYV